MAIDLNTLFNNEEQLTALRRRFNAKLRIDGDCLIWTGGKTPKGYGVIGYGPRRTHVSLYTHRLALWFATGQDAGASLVMHSCDNPACCNAAHLSLGTYLDNTHDMLAKERESRGEDHPGAKLSEDDVRAIRKDPRSLNDLAAVYGVDMKQIHRIKRRENWKHVA